MLLVGVNKVDLLTLTAGSYGAAGVQFSGQHASFVAVTHICFLAVQVTYQSLTCLVFTC